MKKCLNKTEPFIWTAQEVHRSSPLFLTNANAFLKFILNFEFLFIDKT